MHATTYGLDLAKTVFHAYWVDEAGTAHRRKMKRDKVLEFFAKQPPGVVAMEACASAHHWGRELLELGHQVKLIAAQHVKRFVLTNKSDAADAQAIWTAAQQPHVRGVPVKTLEQQAVLMLLGERQHLIKERTAKVNRLRAILAECGEILPRGRQKGLAEMRARIAKIEQAVPTAVFGLLASISQQLKQLDEDIAQGERRVHEMLSRDDRYRRLLSIPGVGPLTAAMLWAMIGDARQFASGRQAAAWVGLVPRHSGTGGKTVVGRISKRGDPTLRTLLIHGARSVITHGKHHTAWLQGLLERRPPNVAAVALANKTMRIAWKLLVSNTTFDAQHDPRKGRQAPMTSMQAA